MTKELAISILTGDVLGTTEQTQEAVGMAVKALSEVFAQPQLEICPIYGGMCGYPSNLCYECPRHEGAKEQPQWWTEGLQPFAQPQRMKGRWIDCSSSDHYKCSVCGCRTGFWLEDNDTLAEWLSDFCPSCGADMRGGEDAVN